MGGGKEPIAIDFGASPAFISISHCFVEIVAMSEDQILQCLDCQQDFAFSVQEQEFFAEKGFSSPKRCRPCRAKRRERRKQREEGSSASKSARKPWERKPRERRARKPRERHDVICVVCGIETQVPFKPREDQALYCRDCYQKPE